MKLVKFSLNSKVEICFDPSDSAFAEQLFNTFDALDQRYETYRSEISTTSDKRRVYEIDRKADSEMREIIDGLLGSRVSEVLFSDVRVYAMSGGRPLWANLLLAVADKLDTDYAREQRQRNLCIAKYMKMHKLRIKRHGKKARR